MTKRTKKLAVSDPNFNLCKEIAQKITSKYNQHETAIVVGDKGTGKSWAGLRIAYDVSVEVAKIKGGKPEDYFTFENVAIITKDEVLRVLKTRMGQYCVVIFDDIGVGWSNRDFATKFNKVMNGVYQTFRTRNVFLIMTVPDDSYIDKLPRLMLHYFIEVVDSYFHKGFVEIKIKESKKLIHMNKNIYPYISRAGIRYPRHAVLTAPEFLTTPYEIARTKIEKESSDKGLAELEAMEIGEEQNISKKKQDILRPGIFAMNEQGLSQRKIAQLVGCSQGLVQGVLAGEL